MPTTENEGGEERIDSSSRRFGGSASRGGGGLTSDVSMVESLKTAFKGLKEEINGAGEALKSFGTSSASAFGGRLSAMGTKMSSRISMPVAGADSVIPTAAGSGGGASKISMPTAGGLSGGGGGGSLGSSVTGLVGAIIKPGQEIMQATSSRIGRGAEYSLQADRMSVQLQQMYGMSNAQVRNQLRMPLTQHYLLGGGNAINELLGMQAATGLNASRQAGTVEALRTVSGFSYGAGDITKMLTTMASPDVANRMFMMGGGGIYGIGGRQRSGMSAIQDIVKRTGLTNPEALKGALQQGSNTRQRLTAMGVPADMQDMVIQYAMQNTQYQRKTGTSAMYDPSQEQDRKALGIEDNYAVQHEKTTGERLKREERFYGRQTDNFARFEKNLRLTTQALASFEDALSSFIGMGINIKGHPLTNTAQFGMKHMTNIGKYALETAINLGEMGLIGGDAGDGRSGDAGDGISAADEKKLATLDPKLAVPLRNMLAANNNLHIGDAKRDSAQQERSFKDRYRPTNRPLSSKGENDRIWNGVLWEMKPGNSYPMAAPGNSYHEIGLAADVQGDPEWIRSNSARFGLDNGGTTKGRRSDEPFHVQPAGTLSKDRVSLQSTAITKNKTSSGKVSIASAKVTPLRTTATAATTSTGYVAKDAGAMAVQAERAGLSAQVSSIIGSIDKPSTLMGDAGDGRTTATTGGGYSITVSPNIYMNGTQDQTGDLRRIAKEVAAHLEREVRLTMMRVS